jgi:fibronectin-binding autotransporter adhesin
MNTNSKPTPLSAKTTAWAPLRRLAGVLAFCLVAGTFSAWGATCTWTGGASPDANWSNVGNWSRTLGGPPQDGDDLVFPAGPSSKSPINDIGAALSTINSVTISDSGYDVTSSSGTTLVIVNGFINSSSSGVSNWRIKLSLAQAQTFSTTTAGASTAFLNTWNLNGYTLAITGAGELDQTYTISGTGGITKSGAGYLSLANLGNNTYTGKTLVTGGTLFIIQESNLGGSPGSFVADQLTLDGGTLEMGLSDTIGFNNLNLGITLGSGGGTFSIDATKQLVVDNEITGPGSLTKTGAGTLKLSAVNSGANTYTGKTTVLEGTLSINDENRLGTNPGSFTADLLTINGGTLNAFANFSFANNRGMTLGASGGTISINIGNTLTIAEAITGPGSLTKTVGGTLTLSAANSYAGKTIVSAGILSINGENCLGSNPSSFTSDQLTINDTATLDTFGSFSFGGSNRGITLTSGTGTISVEPGLTLQVANVITGSGALSKTGTGTLTLSGINTYSGATTVNAGKLLGVTGASCASSAVTVSATTATNGVTVTDNTKQWTCAGLTYSAAGKLDVNFGSIAPSMAVAPIQVNGNMAFTVTPSVTIEGISFPSGAHDYPLITWTGAKSGTAPTTPAALPSRVLATLTVSGNTLYLHVTGSTEPLSYYGTGNKNWTAASVWKDNTGATTTFANGDSVQMLDTIVSGSSPFTITISTAANVLPANVLVSNSSKAYIIAASSSGGIGGTTALTKTGNGSLTLNLASIYSGGTTLSNGTLVINNAGALGSGTFTVAGGTIDTAGIGLVLNGTPQKWNGDFAFAGASQSFSLGNGPVALSANRQVTVAANTLSVGGVISDNGGGYGLTKAGVGTLVLTGDNTYTGATTVNAGILQVDGSTASGSAVTVDPGATLTGTGTVGGTVDVNGTIIPDDNVGSPGTLNTGAETWSGGGNYLVNIGAATGTPGTDWDLLNITGTLGVAATSDSQFTIVLGSTDPALDNTQNFTWRIATASGGVTGFDASKFTIDVSSFPDDVGSGHFIVTQSGNDVNLEFVHVIANPVTLGRAWGTIMRIPVDTVLANANGGTAPLILQSVTSRDGDFVQINGSEILFAPTGNATRILDYTVADSSAPTPFTASSTITVTVTNAVSAVNTISSTGNGVTISFAGIPGYNYVVERSSSAADWTSAVIVQTVTAPAEGVWTFNDPAPPNPSFYRLRQNN